MKFPTLFRRKKPEDITTTIVSRALGGPESQFAKFQVKALVSEGMEIIGKVVSRNGAAIDGVLFGDLEVIDMSAALLLRPGSRVEGNIRAGQVFVAGEVIGDIDAVFVRLYPGSRVRGRVRSRRLLVDDGAVIDNDAIKVDDGSDEARGPLIAVARKIESCPAQRQHSEREQWTRYGTLEACLPGMQVVGGDLGADPPASV